MHLKRVRVPDFRVLKDIDITFEQDLVPRIFPLGSLNGGGKSTLLQLIFTLLHCCGDETRIRYLQSMIEGFEIDSKIGKRDLASINLILNEKEIELSFLCCSSDYLEKEIESQLENSNDQDNFANFVRRQSELIDVMFWGSGEEYSDAEKIHNSNISLLRSKWLEVNYYYVCGVKENEPKTFLVCKFNELDIEMFKAFVKNVSHGIFLAAPITQVFRFIPQYK
jgi:predicted ATP-binding protein involved in virulence